MLLHTLPPMLLLTCTGCCAAPETAYTAASAAGGNAYRLLHVCFFSNCRSLRPMMQCQTSETALPVPYKVNIEAMSVKMAHAAL